MRKFAYGLAALALLAGCDAQPGQQATIAQAPACDFDCTLSKHLTAIQQFDLPAFETTITKGPDIRLIFPDGTLVTGREQYMETLRGFLGAKNYDSQYRIVEQEAGTDMGYALLDVTQLNEGMTVPSRYYLLLIFANEDGEWRLIHDQNTRHPPAEAAPLAGG